MLRVKPIPGEPTRYHVQSDTLQCSNPQCGKLARRVADPTWFSARQLQFMRTVGIVGKVTKALAKLRTDKALTSADQCRSCGAALEHRHHLVDLMDFNGSGSCSCEYFATSLGPELKKLTKSKQFESGLQCRHIEEAYRFSAAAWVLWQKEFENKNLKRRHREP